MADFNKIDAGIDAGLAALAIPFLINLLKPGANTTRTEAVKEFFTKNASAIKQQTPYIFGLGYNDEAILADVLANFTVKDVKAYTDVNAELKWWERKFLRLMVGNMKATELPPTPSEEEKFDKDGKVVSRTKTNKPNTITGTDNDPRIKFVKLIVKYHAAHGAAVTADMLRKNQLVVEDTVHLKALHVWKFLCEEFEDQCKKVFKVESINDITKDMLTKRLNAWSDSRVEARAQAPAKALWKRILQPIFGNID